MYYFYFILYLLVGFVMCLIDFLWALKNGQFKDQQRARFIPLDDEEEIISKASRPDRFQGYVLSGLLIFGLLAGASVLIYAHLL